ncbi:MAG: histidine kinase [Chitinophagales bacterium]|nr:histidine kinase [Chitinophagales bacterium]
MNLGNTIDALELRIPDVQGIEELAVYAQLCQHLVLANNHKLNKYCAKILDSTEVCDRHPLKLQAKLHMAGGLMNQLDTPKVIALLESTKLDVFQQSNEVLHIDWLRNYALAMIYSGKSDEGIAAIEKCMGICKETTPPVTNSFVYSFASICFYERDLVKSGTYAIKSLEYAHTSGKNWQIGYATLMLGYWARENKMPEKTLVNFLAAAEMLKHEGADEYYANALIQLSIAYKDKEQYNEAIQLLHDAKPILEHLQNKRLLIIVNYSIGRCYRVMKEVRKAEQNFIEALQIATSENNEYEMAVCNVFLGYLYRDTKDIRKAIEHIEKAIALFGDNVRPSNKADIYKHLHPLYQQAGDTDKAYKTLLTYTDIRFQLQDENRIKESAQLQEKYEAKKKEAELQKTNLLNMENELKALKAQMNPHFIFNSLNSIQEIFFMGDKQLANEHLSRFSQLMRSILKASSRQSVSLHEDITMLHEYLALETLRLGDLFSYSISHDDTVDVFTIEIPPMVLQPFVENAIKHGLQHKHGEKKLSINFTFIASDELLQCQISDNGIGRKASAVINEKRIGHQSFATSAMARRFQILNQNSEQKFDYRYLDNTDDTGNSTGTTVLVTIPDMFI